MTNFQPSKYQQAIFDWVNERIPETRRKPRNLVVQAGPGSGKTTTLVQAANLLPADLKDKAIFVAFNRHIVQELKERLPRGMQVKTLHGVGYGAILWHFNFKPGRDWVDPSLHRKYAQDWMMEHKDKLQLDSDEWKDVQQAIVKLINLCQLTLTEPRDVNRIWQQIAHYGLHDIANYAELAIQSLPPIFDRIIREVKTHISYNEMIWLPAYLDMRVRQYDIVMADECQDFNLPQRWLIQKMTRRTGFGVWVGDPRQAIYGFAFASTQSVQEIINETKAESLPLSICYRCPSSHVALANSVFPEANLEARHGAPEGQLQDVYDFQAAELVSRGDLVICRLNAPLIPLCFRLIREGIAAKIKGKDIGKNLIDLIKKIEKQRNDGIDWSNPYDSILEWAIAECEMLRNRIKDEEQADMACEILTDKTETILAIWEANRPSSTSGMTHEIDNLFADDSATVWLSTIHKAKGLEAESVFILAPSKMPHPMAKKVWEREQEENMRYIAYSRAKQNLYFCWNEDEPGCPAIPLEDQAA